MQEKFKHADVLGIVGNYNKENAQKYKDALIAHVFDANVQQIIGTFGRKPVIHYYKHSNKVSVMTEMNGAFISTWELSDEQEKNLEERRSL